MFPQFPSQSAGVWTPSLTFATPGDLVVTYNSRRGSYARYGDIVTLSFAITTNTFTHSTASGALQIQGVPFIVRGSDFFCGALHWQGITKANFTYVTARIGPNSPFFILLASGSGQVASVITTADMPSAGAVGLVGAIVYAV